VVQLELSRGWRISGAEGTRAAADELEEGLRAITGRRGGGRGVAFEIVEVGGSGEGFRWEATADAVTLEGVGPRGLLHGVFGLLAALGLRWPWPGRAVRVGDGSLALAESAEDEPVVRERCLVLGHRALLEAGEEWIVWAARQRLNAIFVHVGPGRAPFGAAPERLWQERRARLVALARDRAMTIEHGGHLFGDLVTGEVLASVGRELEAGSPAGGVEALQAAVAAHARAHPEADVLHLWGADTAAGAASATAASERALRLTNAAAAAVERSRPSATVASLAYHDTLAVPTGTRPRGNVCLLWAPRERSYGHPADAEPNAQLWALFRRHVAHYAAAGARPTRVYEYYVDGIRFPHGVPDLGAVMAADLRAYAAGGAHAVQALMTGAGRPPSVYPNPALFAQLSWDPGQDARALHRDGALRRTARASRSAVRRRAGEAAGRSQHSDGRRERQPEPGRQGYAGGSLRPHETRRPGEPDMSYTVDSDTVSTAGLESSPFADALAGLRANEARYFKNKYDHVFTVEPASDAKATIEWVHRSSRTSGTSSSPLALWRRRPFRSRTSASPTCSRTSTDRHAELRASRTAWCQGM
jgi:hypothetical protein